MDHTVVAGSTRTKGRSRRIRRTAVAAAAGVVVALSLSAVSADGARQGRNATDEPGVTANLWEWNWKSIGKECTDVLGPSGYTGVQVAPPQDSVKRTELGNGSDTVLHPWWEVYQAVDYKLTSRMGYEDQFKAMVKTCREAGVKVYVHAVINHTTVHGQITNVEVY
jgi:alpha-amylase